MEDDIIDLNAERNKRDQPDSEFIRHDDYGRPLYIFLLEYEMDERQWSTRLWAYDFDDAEARVAGMRNSLKVNGKLYELMKAKFE